MQFIDDLGRPIELQSTSKKIISLVPSITELLFDLSLDKEIVACTSFCVHPKEKVKNLVKVGGPKDFNLDKIRDIKPDLIIAVKEENNKDLVLEISKEFPLVVFDIVDVESAIKSIKSIGKIVGKEKEATLVLHDIDKEKENINSISRQLETALYLIWNKPMMSINAGTFISEMMHFSGFKNIFSESRAAYPRVSKQEIDKYEPKYILLSSEPFSFTEKHRKVYQEQFPYAKVVLVDGEMFSWYGSRMIKAFRYFGNLRKSISL